MCQQEIFLGTESNHGIRGKMLLLDYKQWGIKELVWVSTSGDGLSEQLGNHVMVQFQHGSTIWASKRTRWEEVGKQGERE